jgi:hypothetical protein
MNTTFEAVLSPCGKYRYRLSRRWGSEGPCLFIMLNPSTADASLDDPTIRRCIGFAKSWGHGELVVVNLFAVRATNPKDMFSADDPVGPDNMRHIKEAADYVVKGVYPEKGGPIICAWGANGSYMGQAETVLGWLKAVYVRPMCLTATKTGQPGHPLYLPKHYEPQVYSIERKAGL